MRDVSIRPIVKSGKFLANAVSYFNPDELPSFG
jgi:hypothetical protein